MVTRVDFNSRTISRAKGMPQFHKTAIRCYFPPELFNQIQAEAAKRGWSFSHMVIHLCEASIDGIE